MTQRVKVVYIMGALRSGSTLLDRVLGELPGFFAVGELRMLWTRFGAPRQCGCGKLLADCEVWAAVMAQATPHLGTSDIRQVVAWQRDVTATSHIARLLREKAERPSERESVESYKSALSSLYNAIAGVTGARVIIDSSKIGTEALLVGLLTDITPYFVHLVRDPRAVAFSWTRPRPEPDAVEPGQMILRRPVGSTSRWVLWNAVAEIIRRRYSTRSLLLRYEEFVKEPRAAVERIVALVGESASSIPLLDDRTALLGPGHLISSNPNRYDIGKIAIRSDDEWLTRMRPRDRFVATTLAMPLLIRYGYKLRPDSSTPHR
jgi:hypothetical protein